jgi:hypothetical protein
MAEVKIHGRFSGGALKAKEYLVISASKQEWLEWIPGVIPGGQLLGAKMSNGERVVDIGTDALFYLGGVPAEQLNVTLRAESAGCYAFEITGKALRHSKWSKPANWHLHAIMGGNARVAGMSDMPVFKGQEACPPTKPSGPSKPRSEMTFYEMRLAESQAKSREEDASAHSNRAFEFL